MLTKKGLENIRHIIPYHLIRDSFEAHLNAKYAEFKKDDGQLASHLADLCQRLAIPVPTAKEGEPYTHTLVVTILRELNSVPANLWAGSAEENQRLNSLRIRLDRLTAKLENGDLGHSGVRSELRSSLKDDNSDEYQGLIQGALKLLPKDSDPVSTWLSRLELAKASAEFDVFPAEGELDRIFNKDQFLQNIGGPIMAIAQKFQNGAFEQAAVELVQLPSPHRSEDDSNDDVDMD